jgi:choline kinase
MYRGLIAAAGLSTRLLDLSQKRNKVLLDLGGQTVLGNILTNFGLADIDRPIVMAGSDGQAVRRACEGRADCVLNPFFQEYGILSSLWLARPHLEGQAFVFTTGDHYFTVERLRTLLADQPEAEILVDVELKTCDDEDMKVYLDRAGKLRTMTKTLLKGPILGEFTGLVRCSAEGSTQLFTTLTQHAWQNGINGYLADVLCTVHARWELAFHLSNDHHRIDIDFPCDLTRARQLFSQVQLQTKQAC